MIEVMSYAAQVPDWVWPIIILAAAYVVGKICYFFLKRFVERLAKHTTTKVDDLLICALERPIYLAILLLGLRLALYMTPGIGHYTKAISISMIILWTLLGVWTLVRVMSALWDWMLVTKKFDKRQKTSYVILRRTLNIVIYLVAFLLVLSQLGVAISPLLASLGVGGLAVALALQDTLTNYFASIYLTTDKTIHHGDYIELDGTSISGVVESITWRATKIRALANNIVIIPNGKLAESIVINHALPQNPETFGVDVGVSYSDKLDKVEKVALAVGKKIQKKTKGADPEHVPTVRFTEFGDSSINFTIFLRINERLAKYPVRHAFIKELKKAFDKEKISIPFPQRDIWMRK